MMRLLATAALIGAVAAAAGCESANPASPGTASRIVVLGDSLAISPRADIAFPAVLQSRLDQQNSRWQVTSVSTNGATTADGLAHVDAALADSPTILILELGANDGLQGIDISVIRSNLASIIARAKASGARVLLCGMETTPLHGLSYFGQFRDLFPSLAHDVDIPVTPFILGGVVGDPGLTTDLVHPNGAGAKRIADIIWPKLQEMLATSPQPAPRPVAQP